MTYAGVGLSVLLSWGVVAWESLLARRGRTSADGVTIRLLGLTGTRGFHLAAWGIALTVLAAPIDDLWHRLFGLDVTIWSPPHLLGIFGAAVNTVGCLLIATEVYAAERSGRLLAAILFGAMLYGTLHLVVDPSNLVAYRRGGVFFYTLAILSALILPSALVTTARVARTRWAPVLVLLVIIPMGIVGGKIAQLGFAWLEPVSVIEEEIAKDSESPIALAHAIAMKNGTTPGRTGGVLHIFALLPAVVMAALDPRRRPRLATVGYAATLFVAVGVVLSARPAFAPLVPGLARHAGGIRADDRRGGHRRDGGTRALGLRHAAVITCTRRSRLKAGIERVTADRSRGAVLITGASTGIGAACALHLDRLGFRVWAGVRRPSDGEALVGQASPRLTPVILDVTDPNSIAAALAGVAADAGRRRRSRAWSTMPASSSRGPSRSSRSPSSENSSR